ncbi:MAG: DUF1998 domain-containing protein, partial [Candidatus Sericytochromatia bacterium]|nr:DUF1998 domain-containing protein [Candidatus Tanganyikabacteria bacterium]
DCGYVKEPDPRGEKKLLHAPYCKSREGVAERTAQLFLYREVKSEAIRVLLPLAAVGVPETRASFKAAINLGFRRKFRGNPGHLLIKAVEEPIGSDGDLHRRFLVIYDGVPGGTGYLAELWKRSGSNEGFMEVLQLALDALRACPCRLDPGKDGCYRCLYAYQAQRELPLTSRNLAIELLSSVIARAGDLRNVATLSAISLDSRIESELEQKFLDALRQKAASTPGWGSEEVPRGGKRCWRLQIGQWSWLVEPQVRLGPSEHVSVRSQPDFLLTCLNGPPGTLPVAVFCDGLAFHVCPEAPRGIVGDDVLKRTAIRNSGQFISWSVTWKDVEEFQKGADPRQAPTPFSNLAGNRLRPTFEKAQAGLPWDLVFKGSMGMLLEYLQDPQRSKWERAAQATMAAALLTQPWPTEAALSATRSNLGEPGGQADLAVGESTAQPPALFGWIGQRKWLGVVVRSPAAALKTGKLDQVDALVRLFDDATARKAPNFEESWRAAWNAWNLLQFHQRAEILSTEYLTLAEGEAETSVPGGGSTAGGQEGNLAALLGLVASECRPFLAELAQLGLPLPEPGFEIAGPKGRVVLEAEMAWPDRRLAISLNSEPDAVEAAREAGWTVREWPVGVE